MSHIVFFLINFFVALALAVPVIKTLEKLKSEQVFREGGVSSHKETKAGTPTMGGIIFLIPIILGAAYLFISFDGDEYTKAGLLVSMLGFLTGGVLGFVDDYLKILKKNYAGVNSVTKLAVQLLASTLFVFLLNPEYFALLTNPEFLDSSSLIEIILETAWAFIVIAGTTNAINLTDGLDGLATGICIVSFISFATVFTMIGEFSFNTLCMGVIGTLLAFLFFNKHPAKIFMGDTGSLALGMGLGAIAYAHRLEWYLLAFAIVPVLEALSVIAQVLSAKFSRKLLGRDLRPFKMAPLHHHLELCDIEETKVVRLLWTVQLVVSGVFLFYLKSSL